MTLITVQYAVKKLLRYFSPNERQIPGTTEFGDSRIEACLDAIHQAGVEVNSLGPLWPSADQFGALINAPASLTGTVVNGTSTVTVAADLADWMTGCTCAFDGDVRDNEIVGISGTTVTMRDPVLMTSGDHPLTVWHDCVDMDDDASEAVVPVIIAGRVELNPVTGQRAAVYGSQAHQYFEDYGFHNRTESQAGTTSPTLRKSRHRGMPINYYVEAKIRGDTEFVRALRLSPMPNTEEIINYGGRTKRTTFSVADVTAGTAKLLFPPEFVGAVLLKVAAQHLTECPWFKNKEAKPEIARGYKQALKILRSAHPQSDSGVKIRPKY